MTCSNGGRATTSVVVRITVTTVLNLAAVILLVQLIFTVQLLVVLINIYFSTSNRAGPQGFHQVSGSFICTEVRC